MTPEGSLTPDPTPQPYAAAWRDYRRRRWAVVAVVASMAGLSCFGLAPSRDTAGGQAFWWAAWAVLVALVVRWFAWPCPRCGHPFRSNRYVGGKYGRNRCDHCGLPMWSPRDPDPDSAAPRW
jgi:hypothetical protein